MYNLSNRQQKILQIIADLIEQHRFPPTMQEVGILAGIKSKNAVSKHFDALEKKGYISRSGKRTARNVTLANAPQTKMLPVIKSGSKGLKEFLEGLDK